MKTTLLIFGLFVTSVITAQEHFVRYNQAGYKTLGKKSLIINSSHSLNGTSWSISHGDSVILNGVVKKSITGKGDHTNFLYNYKLDFSSVQNNGLLHFNQKVCMYTCLA